MSSKNIGSIPSNERDILARGGRYGGRKPNAIPGGSPIPLDRAADARKRNLTFVKGARDTDILDPVSAQILEAGSGTSIFDPVLCEIAYRWFSPPGGLVLDPFAGGSVRGIVAAKLGRRYLGVELRPEQVVANRAQAESIIGHGESPKDTAAREPERVVEQAPEWIEGDSRDIPTLCDGVKADLIFSCPPYADLEVYSDDPRDISTMPYADFLVAYREIIRVACDRLVPDSFACFVVGEVRDKKGNYIDFVGDTVQAFRDAGLAYYNEAILLTAIGSLPIRVGKQFSTSRKLGKTHQNILVFVKGDGKRAATRCGAVEIDDALFEDGEPGGYGDVL